MKILNAFRQIAVLSIFYFAIVITNVVADANVRIDPLNTLTGTANLQVDFGISSAWTLGPTLQYLNRKIDGFEAKAYGVGVRGNYYFNGSVFTQGWYLGPSISFIKAEVKEDNATFGDLEGSASGFAATVIGGYQWMWENFNINLGAGPVFYSIGEIEVENDAENYSEDFDGYNGVALGLEFTLGWKF